MLSGVLQDLRIGARQLARNPGFTLIAVFSLAVGIGANTATFSFADGLMLRPLPLPDPSAVVTVGSVADATRSAETARLRVELSLAAGDGASTLSEGVVDFASGDSELRTGPLGAELGDDALIVRTVGDDAFVDR